VQQAGLGSSEGVLLRVSLSRLTLLSPLDPRTLFEAFASKIKEELGDLNREYRLSDGHMVEEYLAMSEAQRAALWEDAFREAMEELEGARAKCQFRLRSCWTKASCALLAAVRPLAINCKPSVFIKPS
jgi:hypothetical protein